VNTNKTKQNRGGAFLLLLVGVYFSIQFRDLDTSFEIIGMMASVFIFCLGLYSLFKGEKSKL
jgi:hypothetical protein